MFVTGRILMMPIYNDTVVLYIVSFLTLVKRTGAVRRSETTQTTMTALRQLLIVHTDRDRMGNTMTINLCKIASYKTDYIMIHQSVIIRYLFSNDASIMIQCEAPFPITISPSSNYGLSFNKFQLWTTYLL